MAGMGHHEGGERGDQRGENDRAEHEGQHGQEFSGEQDRPSRLAHEKLAERAQAVFAGDLGRGDAEGDDPQEHGSPIDAMDEAVRLGELREARKVSAAGGRGLGEEEDGEERCGSGQPDIGPNEEVPALQLHPFAAGTRPRSLDFSQGSDGLDISRVATREGEVPRPPGFAHARPDARRRSRSKAARLSSPASAATVGDDHRVSQSTPRSGPRGRDRRSAAPGRRVGSVGGSDLELGGAHAVQLVDRALEDAAASSGS